MIFLVALFVATKLKGEEKKGEGKRLREKGGFVFLKFLLLIFKVLLLLGVLLFPIIFPNSFIDF